jgi:hypothetical protein
MHAPTMTTAYYWLYRTGRRNVARSGFQIFFTTIRRTLVLFKRLFGIARWLTPPPDPLSSLAGEGEKATKSPSLARLQRGI